VHEDPASPDKGFLCSSGSAMTAIDGSHAAEPSVIGPEGFPLTLETLPSPLTKRWVSRRKVEVVVAVESGLLTLHDVCARYRISPEEFLSWQARFSRHGLMGLHVTRRLPLPVSGTSEWPLAAGCRAKGNSSQDQEFDRSQCRKPPTTLPSGQNRED
jgi:hypothetical protein